MLYLCNNQALRPSGNARGAHFSAAGVPMDAYVPLDRARDRDENDGGAGGGGGGGGEYQRNGWHGVWCTALSLVASLVRELGTNPQFFHQVGQVCVCVCVWVYVC